MYERRSLSRWGPGYHGPIAQTVKLTKVNVEQRRAAAERARGSLSNLALGPSLVDELIAERGAEARAEDREDAARRRRAER